MTAQPSGQLRAHGHGMRYRRILQLGSGGMAIVHLSLAIGQSGFKRLVVVKAIRDEFVANPEMRQLFLAEARLSARLNHPNVVQVSEVVDSTDGVMLVMEYLDGLSFAGTYHALGDALTLPMRIRVLCEVLSGLDYAHELTDYHGAPLGIVHRDVSAQNVFITYDGRVKLLDFGIAKATAAPDLTRAGVIKGRIAYMPIEQLRGDKVDRRADVYAAGCLLWEAIAGTRMWDKLSEGQIVRRVFEGKLPPISARAKVDPELERIVNRATGHEPAQRYSTAEAMRLDLERYLGTRSPVTLREIGALLSTTCAEEREQRQELIARAIDQLERDLPALDAQGADEAPASAIVAAGGASIATEGNGSGARPLILGSGTDTIGVTPTTHARAAAPMRRRSGTGWLFASALAVAGAIGVVVYQRSLVDLQQASTATAPAPVAADALLKVEVSPEGARVLVDGVAVDGSPATLRVPSNTEHSIRVELAGHVPAERRVLVDVDTSLRIDLDPIADPASDPAASSDTTSAPQRSRVHGAPSPGPRRQPREKASPEPKKADCDPPYYFSGGIKTYKPECL